MALLGTATVEAVRDRFDTTRDQIARSAKRGRRLVTQAQGAVEDGAAAVSLQVRRRPLTAVAGAALAGALAGAVLVVLTGRVATRRRWF